MSEDKNTPHVEKKQTHKNDSAAAGEEKQAAAAAGDLKAEASTLGKGDHKALTEQLASLQAENNEIKDKYLRKYAEFENYKKRINREREETAKFSNAMLLLDVTKAIDDLERALKSAEENKDFSKFHEGVSLIEKQLVSTLEKKWGLERFIAKGADFDPERHEAVLVEQNAEAGAATVLEDLQSGYLLHGKVLRPAKVKVRQPPIRNTAESETGAINKNEG